MFHVVSLKRVKKIGIVLSFVTIFLFFIFDHPVLNKAREVWGSPLMGKRIVIDPGHGGPDGGAESGRGVSEKHITLQISHYVRDFLEGAGASVILTRDIDKDLADPATQGLSRRKAEDLRRRIELVHNNHADLFISIHLNWIPSPKWFGAQSFFNPVNDRNRKLATSIQGELVKNMGNTGRASRPKDDVYLLRQSRVPTALVEVGFLSNPQEARLLSDDMYQRKLASAIYYGILHYESNISE